MTEDGLLFRYRGKTLVGITLLDTSPRQPMDAPTAGAPA
jgi:hypothetical protein